MPIVLRPGRRKRLRNVADSIIIALILSMNRTPGDKQYQEQIAQ
jgi:hypothetical protein